MKTKITFIALLLWIGVLPVMAFLTSDFPGWDSLTQKSPYIIIVKCKSSPGKERQVNGGKMSNPLPAGPLGGIVLTDAEIVFVLKGKDLKPQTPIVLWSRYWPLQGESYLLFATDFDGENSHAFDEYRVIPLGHSFETNSLMGKTLDDQIQILLQSGINNLDSEIKRDTETKQRLESGLKK